MRFWSVCDGCGGAYTRLGARAVGVLVENPLSRSLCGAACITAAEYVVGCTVNRHFRLRVWDYSHEFGNVQGQICPKYAVLWTLLAAPIMLPK